MSLIEREFECPCCGQNRIHQETFDRFFLARRLAETPFVINSGYRCESHNTEIHGSATSSHLKGHAADIKCVASRERYQIVDGLRRAGFTRIGVADTFVHADDDPDKDPEVMWLY